MKATSPIATDKFRYGRLSAPAPIGISQGSILGLLLFLTHINDLPNCITNYHVHMYADDIVLYVDSSTPNGNKSKLDSDLHSLEQWFKVNRLYLIVTKTKFMIYGRNQILKRFVNLELSLDGTTIECTDQFRYLGVIFDENLNWSDHINLVYKKASSKLFLFRKLCPFFEIKQAKTVFTALVQSILDYGDIIWFSSSQKTLQSVQNKEMRCILNIPNKLIISHPASDLLDTLDWTDLRTRRQQHQCRLAFHSLRGDVPPYLL